MHTNRILTGSLTLRAVRVRCTVYLWICVSLHVQSARVLALNALLAGHDVVEPVQVTVAEHVVEQLANSHHNQQLQPSFRTQHADSLYTSLRRPPPLPPVGVRRIVTSLSVCLSVCPLAEIS